MKITLFVPLLLILGVLGIIAAAGVACGGGTGSGLIQPVPPQTEEATATLVTQCDQYWPWNEKLMDLSVKCETTSSDGQSTGTAFVNGQIKMRPEGYVDDWYHYKTELFYFDTDPSTTISDYNISVSGTYEGEGFYCGRVSASYYDVSLRIQFACDYSWGYMDLIVYDKGTCTTYHGYTQEYQGGMDTHFPCRDEDSFSCEDYIETCSYDFKGSDSGVYYKCEHTTQYFGEYPYSVHTVMTATLTPHEEKPLKANPGGPYTVERGEQVYLDGSKSTGSITEYKWTFQPGAGCPAGLSLDAAELKGATQDVTILCPITATLTVTDGKDTDSATVPVTMTPRVWDTPFAEYGEGIDTSLLARPPWFNTSYEGGANICALCEGTANENSNLHPPADGGSWEPSGGYEIIQVTEPDGPFDGYWYVSKYSMSMERKIVINPYILPLASGGKELPYAMGSFYQKNLDQGYDVAGYLAGVRQHEQDHTDRMKQALESAKPAEKIEELFDKDRDAVKTSADTMLRDTEKLICEKSSDASQPPMAVTWSGKLIFPTSDTNQWKEGATSVGGYRQDVGQSCP